jgi:hypothetical protein
VFVQKRMEAVMTGQDAVGALLHRVRDWWRRQEELSALGNMEIGRVAAEFGITTDTLRDLVAGGPEAANLIYERMRALGISKADVDKAAQGVMWDLERTCGCCNKEAMCAKDLAERPDDPAWQSYCPNAFTLDALLKLKARSSGVMGKLNEARSVRRLAGEVRLVACHSLAPASTAGQRYRVLT